MTELRFHRELYRGEAVDEALGVFEAHARLEREESDTHWIVRVGSEDPVMERAVAGELCNYALGLTIRSRSREKGA